MIPTKLDILSQSYLFEDTQFTDLMRHRIYHVLLISSVYDAFILEEDGRIDEQIFNEYMSLNLRYPPEFIKATSEEQAFEKLEEVNIDLVITMLSAEEKDTFELSNEIKKRYPDIPIVVLTPFSREVSLKVEYSEKYAAIDYLFSWLGNADILLAIIKLIEDKMNVEHDVNKVGVQAILLVEDSIRFYSSYLPIIYKIIFKQSKAFMAEGLNEHQKMLRMRGRPKILLATNYEEAVEFYDKYKNNLLGVISDISYKRNGVKDSEAGIRLVKKIKKDNKYMPLLLQSSESVNRKKAKELRVGFIYKLSKSLTYELRDFIKNYFAFGDFVFVDPSTGASVMKAKNLKDLMEKIYEVPEQSLQYHIERNHMSKWLRARALFPLAHLFQKFSSDDFQNCGEVKQFIYEAISNFRIAKARGVITQFQRESFDEYFMLTRIGESSIGGKARGLAFLDTLIKRNRLYNRFDGVEITIPRTIVIGTDIFDEFMEMNNLYKVALSDEFEDEEILKRFINAPLPDIVSDDLEIVVSLVEKPLAIRSSSLLEDSHYQPFAGIYNTYMVPLVKEDRKITLDLVHKAIKGVYASAFYKDSKAYMAATSNVIDEEKMAIVIQVVAGKQYGDHYYPTFSGVARSINFYPVEPEKSEEGIVNIAVGLGKYIVDGGLSLRFSPKYPKKVLQTTNPDMALKETQKHFFALDLNPDSFQISPDDAMNLIKFPMKQGEKDGSIKEIASSYDFHNHMLRDGYNYDGKKLATFAGILKHNKFPLAEIMETVLRLGEEEMGKPVEIEFVVDLNERRGSRKVFNLLQIRPIASKDESVNIYRDEINTDKLLLLSEKALGNGIIDDITDVVYVKPQNFNPANNKDIVPLVADLNTKFLEEGINYILIGPGRWGSSDPWLGIPVKWPHISAARLIIESGLEDYRIDPSQGTHFFQNLTSFRVGYFTINPFIGDGSYDIDFLDKQPAVFENKYIRHVRFEKPLVAKIDGKKNLGIICKPEDS
jgi:CheY-like chemotaxis protein